MAQGPYKALQGPYIRLSKRPFKGPLKVPFKGPGKAFKGPYIWPSKGLAQWFWRNGIFIKKKH